MFRSNQESFGTTPSGQDVQQFTISNGELCVRVIEYGATAISVEVPDRDGRSDNVVLAHNSIDAWFRNVPCFGGTCGRFANRIARGQFSVDGTEYQLTTNHGEHQLHGGHRGFHKRLWRGEIVEDAHSVGVALTYVSEDGEEGYPGQLTAVVTYRISRENELRLDYRATTTRPTAVNLTNHCYWNLRGTEGGPTTVHDQQLRLFCDHYLDVDDDVIPTGTLVSAAEPPMGFSELRGIGEHIRQIPGDGYDHCYVVNGCPGELRQAAIAYDPQSGRMMEVSTTERGLQLYTGNFLTGDDHCGGFGRHSAFCLEAQTFPDAPNQPSFAASGLLRPGEAYEQTTVHRFSVR